MTFLAVAAAPPAPPIVVKGTERRSKLGNRRPDTFQAMVNGFTDICGATPSVIGGILRGVTPHGSDLSPLGGLGSHGDGRACCSEHSSISNCPLSISDGRRANGRGGQDAF